LDHFVAAEYNVANDVTVNLDADLINQLFDADVLKDCFLSSEELAANPDALNLINAFLMSNAGSIGVNADRMELDGIDLPDCDHNVYSSSSLAVSPEFISSLASPVDASDCFISPAEIASDPQSPAMVDAFVRANAHEMDIPIGDFIFDGINLPDCVPTHEPAVAGTTDVNVHPDFLGEIASPDVIADCYLSAEELAADPEAQAMVQAFLRVNADTVGVDVDSMEFNGIVVSPCTPTVSSDAVVSLSTEFAAQYLPEDVISDCYISPDELVADPDLAAIVGAFVQANADTLGISADTITLDGVEMPDCVPTTGR
jgi:hypothetical protein